MLYCGGRQSSMYATHFLITCTRRSWRHELAIGTYQKSSSRDFFWCLVADQPPWLDVSFPSHRYSLCLLERWRARLGATETRSKEAGCVTQLTESHTKTLAYQYTTVSIRLLHRDTHTHTQTQTTRVHGVWARHHDAAHTKRHNW